jgi:hypothetical protein
MEFIGFSLVVEKLTPRRFTCGCTIVQWEECHYGALSITTDEGNMSEWVLDVLTMTVVAGLITLIYLAILSSLPGSLR